MTLTSRAADRVRVRWYELQDRYERLARELHRILDEDTRFPVEAVYTVKHRLKGQQRLLEKIAAINGGKRGKTHFVDHANFDSRIEDLLGVRIVCLRLSDLDKLREYLESLEAEGKLKFVRGPIEKKTFLIRPGDADTATTPKGKTDLQYSGYSSIHYVIRLGRSLRPPTDLASLKAELQLRTILEEAWGEIDHKYRYELTRSGVGMPSNIETGFRDLGLYLQAAARQADHLCEEVERLAPKVKKSRKRRATDTRKPSAGTSDLPRDGGGKSIASATPATLPELFKSLLGFEPSAGTLSYVQRRMAEHSYHRRTQFGVSDLLEALTPQFVNRFREIYLETMSREPFAVTGRSDRDLDVVPLVNFAIFSCVQSREAAEAGLRASLRNRLIQIGR